MRKASHFAACLLFALTTVTTSVHADALFAPPVVYKAGAHAGHLQPVDIDMDGLLDLVVVCVEPEVAIVYRNDGFGELDSVSSFPAGDFPSAICAADFDGDQLPDLAITDRGWANILVYGNEGGGDFQLNYTLPAGGEALDVTTADLNGDSIPDLVVADPWWSYVSLLFSNGTGGFEPPVFKWVDSTPVDVFVADLDGDLDQDIVSTNYWHNSIAMLVNQGDGAMNGPIYLQTTGNCLRTIAVDLDNDYDKDLIVTKNDTIYRQIEIFTNEGEFTFGEGGKYNLDHDLWNITAADFNGDEYLDLAVGCFDSEGDEDIALLLNTGTGAFEPPTYIPGLLITTSLSAVDIDLDGDQDLLVVCSWDSTFAVIYNTSVTTACGDVNNDEAIDLGDVVSLLDLIFAGAEYPGPPLAADVDCNRKLNLGDAAYLLAYLLAGGPPPCANCQ